MTDPPATFRQLVAQMRDAQIAFYATRTRSHLAAAKALEKRVDAWLDKHLTEQAVQAELLTEDAGANDA